MALLDVAVVGASGYSGEELCRWLARHPKIHLTALVSRKWEGRPVTDLFPDTKHANLKFENLSPDEVASRAQVFFLALPHGVAAEYAAPLRKAGKTVIDLSADFRVNDPAVYREFYQKEHAAAELLSESVYALPELHRPQICKSNLLACPGCYPTSILLGLAPGIMMGVVDTSSIVITSMSGVSGAGKKADLDLMFSEMNENARAYSVPKHRHLGEIERELALMSQKPVHVTFVPHIVPLTRGMLTTTTATLTRKCSWQEIQGIYESFYQREPFLRLKNGQQLPEIKNVAHTNFAEIAIRIDERTSRVILITAIDNLGKGASTQAIQVMNIRFGFPEETGLL